MTIANNNMTNVVKHFSDVCVQKKQNVTENQQQPQKRRSIIANSALLYEFAEQHSHLRNVNIRQICRLFQGFCCAVGKYTI